ncbi:porin family protein [Fibrella forsythiae]|uniref:PorT family protein n=1 Tax=Fibrella forsythiae TaxID=2817061 RepID=A0ABS3JHA6_9BACT|nr:porin family protein [Fibrella forsythiae]MBO0948796.1 PorT family protein [Fibrella forsythiae]
MQNARFALLIVSLLFVQSVSYSQSRQRWSFGPRIGLNLTNYVGNDAKNPLLNVIDPDSRDNQLLPGLSAGVGFIYSDVSRFGAAVDLLYSQRGVQSRTNLGSVPTTYINRVNYLELPITARYFLNRSGNFRPNVFFGVVPALRLNASSREKADNKDVKTDVTQLYRPADLGLTAGFQANFRVGDRQRFTADARYTHGITNVGVNKTDLRNQMITVGLGYNFGIGREYRPGDPKLPIRQR